MKFLPESAERERAWATPESDGAGLASEFEFEQVWAILPTCPSPLPHFGFTGLIGEFVPEGKPPYSRELHYPRSFGIKFIKEYYLLIEFIKRSFWNLHKSLRNSLGSYTATIYKELRAVRETKLGWVLVVDLISVINSTKLEFIYPCPTLTLMVFSSGHLPHPRKRTHPYIFVSTFRRNVSYSHSLCQYIKMLCIKYKDWSKCPCIGNWWNQLFGFKRTKQV